MSELGIHQFPCLNDNYGVLIHDAASNLTASIDAPDAEAVARALAGKGWRLTHIFTTHHHGDHTGGNIALKTETGCEIVGPCAEAARIPGIDRAVGGDDKFQFGTFGIEVLDTPGHTTGHISYVIPMAGVAFTGDTLFALGCGRIFEGIPQTMWASLQKLAALPGTTQIYCGHEYTAANARFALTIEPGNQNLQDRAREVEKLRAAGQPALPSRIGVERATNPFLRPHSAEIRARLDMTEAEDWQVFARIRELKNTF